MDAFLASEAKILINVGCCYHSKIYEWGMRGVQRHDKITLLSQYSSTIEYDITPQSMKAATQAVFQYINMDENGKLIFIFLFYDDFDMK